MTGERVLVVEDDATLAPLLEVVLSEGGYRVAVAEDALALTPRAVAAQTDLIVLDWSLPDKDGLTFCQELRAQPEGKRVKVLMLTARGRREDQLAALASGADDYLTKPFDVDVLLARVRGLLRAHAAEHAERRRARMAEALLHLATAAEAPEPLETVLLRICREARLLFEVAACRLELQEGREARPPIADPPGSEQAEVERGVLQALVERALAERTLVQDTVPATEVTAHRTLLVTPLLYQGESFGSLALIGPADADRFTSEDLEMVRQFAHHAAIAIASVRLAEARLAQGRAEAARAAVTEVALAQAAQTDRQQVLEVVASRARELVGGSVAAVLLSEGAGQDTTLSAYAGDLPNLPRVAAALGSGLVGCVLADGRPHITRSYADIPGISRSIREAGLRNGVAVPLLLGAQVVGCLVVADRSGRRPYNTSDVEALQLLASHGAIAIERARLLALHEQRTHLAEEVRQRMEALALLAEARASQLEAVLEQMADAVVVVDREGRVVRINRAAVALLGLPRDAPAEQPSTLDLALADPFTRQPAAERILERALQQGQTTVEREYLYRADGGERLLSVSVAPVTHNGVVSGAVAVMRDVTERRRIEEQLTQADKLRALGELAMGVAHNFNNMLAAIMSRSELLAREVQHPLVAEAVDYVLRAAEDGAAMIRRIQAFAQRANTGVRAVIDVEDLLRDAIAVSEPRWRDAAQRRGATVLMHLDIVAAPPVLGDPGELREVLVNLINNAADALPNGGQITVGSRPLDGQVELWVSDTGIGMRAEVQRHIFEPFFTTKGVEGTGMGLAVSYGIVANHGGELKAESEPGRGTTMRLRLPAATPAEAAAEPPAAPQAAPTARAAPDRVRVLVVDDDPKLASMLQQILVLDGHEVDVCANGAGALAAVAARPYSLVLTDVGMPGMSGLELARVLSQRYPDLPIGLITGWGNAIEPAEREASGARYMLSKPYRIDQVRQMVQAALAGRRFGPPALG